MTHLRNAAIFSLLLLSFSCERPRDRGPARQQHASQPSATVTGTTRRLTTHLVALRTRDGELVTTPDHPFAKLGKGWTRASALAVGDQIQSGTSRNSTTVFAIDHRYVQPRPVYNLTVARTHAYYVGSEALLVHNVDCNEGSSRPDEQDRREREARIREMLEDQRRSRRPRLSLNDSRGQNARNNCTFCTAAALSDADKLSTFLRDHRLDDSAPLQLPDFEYMLRSSHLRSEVTPNPRAFQRDDLRAELEHEARTGARSREGKDPRSPVYTAEAYMQGTQVNTFALVVEFISRVQAPPGSGHFVARHEGHSLLAVKQGDGSILYIDAQEVPPGVYESLPRSAFKLTVYPTDVDYRYNRQLFAAVRDAKPAPEIYLSTLDFPRR
jgi:hypothetical protein